MKGKHYKLWLVVALGAFFIGLGVGAPSLSAAKETIKLKIGSGHPLAGEHIRMASDYFCKELVRRVNAETEYKLEISEHWAGSVAKLGEELEAVEIGILDMAAVIVPFEPTKLYIHNYSYYIPFFTGDPRLINRITVKLYEKIPDFKDVFKKYNQVWLGAGGTGDYALLTKFPVRTTADVKGKKLTAAGPNLPWISGVGAIPVQGNLNEWYTGLQTGVYDGCVMYAGPCVGFKLYEVAKYFNDTHFGAIGGTTALTINMKVWNKLTKDVQKIFQEVGAGYSVKTPEYFLEVHNKSLKTMKDGGVTIYELPFEERVKWAKGLINQPKKFAKEADAKGWPGAEIMKAAIQFGKEEGISLVRNWMDE